MEHQPPFSGERHGSKDDMTGEWVGRSTSLVQFEVSLVELVPMNILYIHSWFPDDGSYQIR